MGLTSPNAPPRGGHVISELPRRVGCLHPRKYSYQAMKEGRYASANELMPYIVPKRIEKDVTTGVILCRI
jgi:hypothetical protein